MVTAAGTDHHNLAAITGRPIRIQAPAARVSIPLALLSANQSASAIPRTIAPNLRHPGVVPVTFANSSYVVQVYGARVLTVNRRRILRTK